MWNQTKEKLQKKKGKKWAKDTDWNICKSVLNQTLTLTKYFTG